MRYTILISLLTITTILCGQTPLSFSPLSSIGELSIHNSDSLHLTSEKISLVFYGEESTILTEYTIENRGDSTVKGSCTLPVNTLFHKDEMKTLAKKLGSVEKLLLSSFPYKTGTCEKAIESVKLILNDSVVSLAATVQDSSSSLFFQGDGVFPPGQSTITVQWQINSGYRDYNSSASLVPHFGERFIMYDFSTAHSWGEKLLDSLTVDVAVRDEAALFLNEHYSLPRMLKKKHDFLGAPYRIMTFTMRQVLLSNMAPLKLSADISPALKTDFIAQHQVKLPKEAITIRCSEPSKEHTFVHLLDDNYATGLTLQSGYGDWVEIEIDTSKINKEITGIYLLNGNWRSENHYKAARRFKTANVEIKGTNDADSFSQLSKKINYSAIDTLETDQEYFGNKVVELFSKSNQDLNKVVKCRITIKDLFAGKKSKDLILSEIILTGHSKKESPTILDSLSNQTN